MGKGVPPGRAFEGQVVSGSEEEMVGNDWVALKVWKVRQGGVWGGMSEAPGSRGAQGGQS